MSHIHEALKKASTQKDRTLLVDALYLSIRDVQAQRGRMIEESKADQLIAAARAVLAELQASQKNHS